MGYLRCNERKVYVISEEQATSREHEIVVLLLNGMIIILGLLLAKPRWHVTPVTSPRARDVW